jgi:hypothetical protein
MSDPLATYLHDHLAGSNFAIDLLKTLRDEHDGEPLGRFAAELLVQVEEDREVLQGIVERVGKGPALKEAAAWLAEKLSQLKLRRSVAGGHATFEALEALALAILGKLALWRALPVIAETDARVRGPDFDQLTARAQAQHVSVEERRLQAARTEFGSATE